jgi:hypothetical protein
MERNARLFNCARCRRQVIICSHCDRGNQYCQLECATFSRVAACRLAGKRYQNSLRGRHQHAIRQHRYRSRKKIVTHQGYSKSPPNDLLRKMAKKKEKPKKLYCHFCQNKCDEYLRLDFLRRYRCDEQQCAPSWPCAP